MATTLNLSLVNIERLAEAIGLPISELLHSVEQS
jgi:hypothetical protein